MCCTYITSDDRKLKNYWLSYENLQIREQNLSKYVNSEVEKTILGTVSFRFVLRTTSKWSKSAKL